MSEAAPAPARAAGSPIVERLWRFFSSPQLTVACLVALGAAAIAGRYVNPGHAARAEIEQAFAGHHWTLRAWSWLELYSLDRSWWFTLLLVALFFNVLALALEHLPRLFLELRHPLRQLEDGRAPLPGLSRWSVPGAGEPEARLARLEGLLRGRGYSTERLPAAPDAAPGLFAEKSRHARLGLPLIFLAVLVMLGGAIAGRLTSLEGAIELPPGGGATDFFEVLRADGTRYKSKLRDPESGQPFVLRCDDVRPAGAGGASAESELSIFDEQAEGALGRKLLAQTVRAGEPLHFAGLTIAQGNTRLLDGQQRAKVAVVEKASGGRHELLLAPGEQFAAADGLRYQLSDYAPDFAGQGPAVQVVRAEWKPGEPAAKDGNPPADAKFTSFWVFSKSPLFDYKNRQDRFAFSFDKLAPAYSTQLLVSRDPTLPVVYLGGALLLLGLAVALSGVHRRVWARSSGAGLLLSAAARSRPAAAASEFAALARELETPATSPPPVPSVEPTPPAPANPSA